MGNDKARGLCCHPGCLRKLPAVTFYWR